MKNIDIIRKVNQIKAVGHSNKRYMTNCYINFTTQSDNREWEIIESNHSLVLINHEYGVDRILFFTTCAEDLITIIKKLGRDNTLEIISKDKNLYKEMIFQMGFEQIAEMQRIASRDISSVMTSEMAKYLEYDISSYAEQNDLDLLYDLLWDTFDTRISHLPDKDKLSKILIENEFRVVKDEMGNIITLHQAVIEPKSYYFNQILNMGDKRAFHSCIVNSIKRYCDTGGKYAYAWVESKNLASMRFFKKYGMKPNGLYTSVYVKS